MGIWNAFGWFMVAEWPYESYNMVLKNVNHQLWSTSWGWIIETTSVSDEFAMLYQWYIYIYASMIANITGEWLHALNLTMPFSIHQWSIVFYPKCWVALWYLYLVVCVLQNINTFIWTAISVPIYWPSFYSNHPFQWLKFSALKWLHGQPRPQTRCKLDQDESPCWSRKLTYCSIILLCSNFI